MINEIVIVFISDSEVLHPSEISGTLISPVDIIEASYCMERSLLIIFPLIKMMEHSNAALWTIQHSEFWGF